MSAVIWCGIVAVWAFVLIPTWVRRGDIHWHRGPVVATQGPASSSHGSVRRLHLPQLRQRHRAFADQSVEAEAMPEQDAVTQVTHASAPPASRGRVAAAPSSGRLGGAARATFGHGLKGSGKKKPASHVRRARRLVALAVLAFVTLIIAIAAGGVAIAVNVAADITLFAYLRHLRAVARNRQARAAREKRARAARQAWERASAQQRASQIDGWRTHEVDSAPEQKQPMQTPDAPTHIDLTALESPAAVDLADAPTEELVAAKAS